MAATGVTHEARLERYAELAVRVGANVQPGQLVEVIARVEHADVARAVTRAAYEAGARYVDVYYSDQHVRRALIEYAADDVLSWTPPWLLERAVEIGDENAAIVALTGDAEPELLADLPGDRVGKARMLELAQENNRQVERAAEQLDRGRRPQRRLGEADVRRARHRPALGARRVLRPARRGRPGRRVARTRQAHRRARPER